MSGGSPIPLPFRYSLSSTVAGPLGSSGCGTPRPCALLDAIQHTCSPVPGALREYPSQHAVHDPRDGLTLQRADGAGDLHGAGPKPQPPRSGDSPLSTQRSASFVCLGCFLVFTLRTIDLLELRPHTHLYCISPCSREHLPA